MKKKTFHNIVLQTSPTKYKLFFLHFYIINIIKLNIKKLNLTENIILKTHREIEGKKEVVTPCMSIQ